jgi:hypothetical protein
MKSSSLKLVEAGIPNPREYRDAIIHDWYLNEDHIKHLDLHILRETRPSDFFFHVKDGELKVKGRSFSVIWVNSPAIIREAAFILISLRYCKHLERGYALVKVLKDAPNHEFPKLEY